MRNILIVAGGAVAVAAIAAVVWFGTRPTGVDQLLPTAFDLVERETGRYLPLEVLRQRFPADPSARTITYCGGGIAASSDAFVLTRLGFTDVAVYTASLQEWVADPANPLVTGV